MEKSMKMKAFRVRLDGTLQALKPLNKRQFTREEIIEIVGPKPIFLGTRNKMSMVLDETPYLEEREEVAYNKVASKMIIPFKREDAVIDFVLGEPLVCEPRMLKKLEQYAEEENNG